jgi:hypothetical protein
MDDFAELRRLVGQHEKLVYEAVKSGAVAALPHEGQLLARAIQEHMHLKHIHHALEFADVREGTPYEITVDGKPVNPIAHVTIHAAVKGQIEQDPLVRAAFEKMVTTGTSAHHAEHILGAMFLETYRERAKAAEAGDDPEKAQARYNRRLEKLVQDSAFRKKVTENFTADHSAFE